MGGGVFLATGYLHLLRGLLKRAYARYWDWKTRHKMERVFRRREDPYGYFTHSHERLKQSRLESFLSVHRYENVLEIGCAEGAFSRRLAGHCRHLWAMDISPTALDRARKHLRGVSNVTFLEGSVLNYEPSMSWNLIVISEVLYYLPRARALQEAIARVSSWIAPGGRLLLAHSYASFGELSIRKGYVEEFLKTEVFQLGEEVMGGEDPRRSKYLISVLDRVW